MLADKFAAKLAREYTTEGYTSRASYISDLPAIQAAIQANGKDPTAPASNQPKEATLHEDVGVPDAVRLVS